MFGVSPPNSLREHQVSKHMIGQASSSSFAAHQNRASSCKFASPITIGVNAG